MALAKQKNQPTTKHPLYFPVRTPGLSGPRASPAE